MIRLVSDIAVGSEGSKSRYTESATIYSDLKELKGIDQFNPSRKLLELKRMVLTRSQDRNCQYTVGSLDIPSTAEIQAMQKPRPAIQAPW